MIKMISSWQACAKHIELREVIPSHSSFQKKNEKWLAIEKTRYCIELKNQWVIVEVHKGFSVDLNVFNYDFPIIGQWIHHRTIVAAILHYALYKEGYDRQTADNAFLRAMKLEGVKIYHRYPLYWSARLSGEFKYMQIMKHTMV